MPRINLAERDGSGRSTGGVQAVQLVLGVIEHLARHKEAGVTEIATALKTTKARVFRHLRTLVDLEYAAQDKDSERYAAGPRLLALARITSLAASESLVQLARPYLSSLRETLGFTVNLSMVSGETVSIVESLAGASLVQVTMRTHASLPLHCTAAGKVLLAERRAQGHATPTTLERFTPHTITDPRALETELDRVRSQGWANAPEEIVLGFNALSAPIRDHRNELIAMVSIAGSIQFIPQEPSRRLTEAVVRTAKAISDRLRL